MTIAFFTPLGAISGGIRIILEMANRLSAYGNKVYLVTSEVDPKTIIDVNGPEVVDESKLPPVDIAIATLWKTAWQVQRASAKKRGYMVQHDERLSFEPKAVTPTYWMHWDFVITIAPWLQRMMAGFGHQKIHLLSPAADPEVFHSYENKSPKRIIFFSRPLVRKNISLGLKALELIKFQRPDIEIITFDDNPIPELPFVDDHIFLPLGEDLGKLYSSATVYMQSAPIEGYGLLAIEALACGTVVVTPDVAGPEVFSRDDQGAIIRFCELSMEDIAKQCIWLIDNPEERKKIEERGVVSAKKINWADEANKLDRFLFSL